MDLEEWDLLSDEGLIDFHENNGANNFVPKSSTTVIDMNYFQKFTEPEMKKMKNSRVIPVPIQLDQNIEEIPEEVIKLPIDETPKKSDENQMIKGEEADFQEPVSQVFFKKLKENEFVDMKMDSPKSLNRGILPQIDVGSYQFEEIEKNKSGIFEKIDEQEHELSVKKLINGDTHLKNGNLGPVKGSLCEDNGLKNKETTKKVIDNGVIHNGQRNERSDLSGPRNLENGENAGKMFDNGACHNGQSYNSLGYKRNLEDRDSCILLAKDAKSRAKVEEFKELLQKEATFALQTCGWSDKVYEYMRSKKRVCVDACSSTDNKEPKNMLIADARSTFISQIPGSLKGSLIEHIRSFSSQK